MIFGSKPVYQFALYNKKKLHCLGKAYSFEQLPVDIKQCPIKVLNNKAEIFFQGLIFNTYVLSIEDKVTVLKSFDDKLTFTKEKLDKSILYTVKTVVEDQKTREVVIFEFDTLFPGFVSEGIVDLVNGKPIFKCSQGSGPILLQTNIPKMNVKAMLAQLDSKDEPLFVEIDNPVERISVKVIKDLNNHKIVENENVKGILLGSKDLKLGEEVNAYVKNVYPGSYCFIEDIKPGAAEVDLIGKEGDSYKVKCKEFIGECKDRKVKKKMKGIIYDISGSTFKFKQTADDEGAVATDFELVTVPKKLKITSESQIKNNQIAAIEYIRGCVEKGMEVQKLFNKYMHSLKENDYLCLFYLKYMGDEKTITEKDINKVIRCASEKFPKIASAEINDINTLKLLFEKKRSLPGFKKLLEAEKDKVDFMKKHTQFLDHSIRYVYQSTESPRAIVEGMIDCSLKSWEVYLEMEDGNYKRNLFRRMTKMNFRKDDMKKIFKLWADFENSTGGNIDEVHLLASEFVNKTKNSGREKQ
ncbi:hypothetical protein GINT2_000342 [Glugoides intestinalis]